jgi:predicted Mrr-cat superfamily restriction endonuclease
MVAKPEQTGARRYWKVSTGKGKDLWYQFVKQSVIALLGPWGDIRQIRATNKEAFRTELAKRIRQVRPSASLSYHTDMGWYWREEMARGDLVCAYKASTVLGWGEIVGDCEWDDSLLKGYPQVRKVDWKSHRPVSTESLPDQLRRKLGGYDTIIPLTAEEFALIQDTPSHRSSTRL